jgi:hypothetical protein
LILSTTKHRFALRYETVTSSNSASYRFWTKMSPTASASYNTTNDACYTDLKFTTSSIAGQPLTIGGTDEMIWAANNVDTFAQYHGENRGVFNITWEKPSPDLSSNSTSSGGASVAPVSTSGGGAPTASPVSTPPVSTSGSSASVAPVSTSGGGAPSASPVSASPVSASPVSASPVSASPVSASPVSASPVSAAPVSAANVSAANVSAAPAPVSTSGGGPSLVSASDEGAAAVSAASHVVVWSALSLTLAVVVGSIFA